MPLLEAAANNALEWADAVVAVALLHTMADWGPGAYPEYNDDPQFRVRVYEIQGEPYERQLATFQPTSNGLRQLTTMLQFQIPGAWAVRWYALVDGDENWLAILPHCNESEFSNQPAICYFNDTLTGWVDAPDHVLAVGQSIIFMSGTAIGTNTQPAAVYDSINGGTFATTTYNTLSYNVAQYGPFKIWIVAEVEPHRFRMVFFETAEELFVPTYAGWGYYQRIDPLAYTADGGTLTIASLIIAGYG